MRVLFATSEAAPLVKTGGLADVSSALPAALRERGVDVRILLPAYRGVRDALAQARERCVLPSLAGLPAARLLEVRTQNGVPTYLLDCPALYDREGGPYQDGSGVDWFDNAQRFGLLSRAAAALGCAGSPLKWRPQVIHCNDWQTGLAPAYLHSALDARAASLITIHNIAFQGIFDPSLLTILGLAPATYSVSGLEFYGSISFLKAALSYADAITTVSPTYAREIQSEPLGFGLQGLLAHRAAALSGILNGIDTDAWDPARDPHIAEHYGPDTLDRKRTNKRSLQEYFGLEPDPDVPLLGMVSRFTDQKGIDLVIEAAPRILRLPAQIVLVGTGAPEFEDDVRKIAARFPGRAGALVGFDEALAHRVEAGADMFLMPSRFEPCGMNQMYSQRYGTPPVVRETGGLADSVVDCTPDTLAAGTATGFTFTGTSGLALLDAVERAVVAYRDPPTWRALQANGMARDFTWRASAARYAELYSRIAPSLLRA
ncbi:MAG: glycogen synthase GlgA [Betaproteobacteria bacterium]|jgi:starch synthase|nr:glycogen synthase GlgA [Betaproteobacteria bacterium]